MKRPVTKVILGLAGAAGGCAPHAMSGLPRIISNGGAYAITYRAPQPVPLNEDFDLTVWVLDAASGAEVRGAGLEVDARMPHHRHGMVQVPEIKRRADGGFEVHGMLCHMGGYWEVYFDVTRDGVTERAQFAFTLE